MSEPAAPYRLIMARSAARALSTTLPEKVATAVYEFVTGPLLDNPRRGTYRVLYLINDTNRTVEVTAISHRADAYHT